MSGKRIVEFDLSKEREKVLYEFSYKLGEPFKKHVLDSLERKFRIVHGLPLIGHVTLRAAEQTNEKPTEIDGHGKGLR